MDGITFWICDGDGLQVQWGIQLRRREHIRPGDCSASRKRDALPLTDIQMLAAAIQFRASGSDGDLLLFGCRIAAHSSAAVRAQRSDGVFKGNFRLGAWDFPCAGSEIHLARANVYADLRSVILLDDVFLHGHKRIAFHRVGSAVGKGHAGHAFWTGLDQIALIERELIIGALPFNGIHFLYLYFSIEVHEACLPRGDGGDTRIVCRHSLVKTLHNLGGEIGEGKVRRDTDSAYDQDDVQGHGLVCDRVPIDFDPRDFRLCRFGGFLVYHDY